MSLLKSWCVHPTRHMNDMKLGLRPSRPRGHHPISAELARNLQARWSRPIGMTKIIVREGDLLCKVCYHRERDRFNKLYRTESESIGCGDDDCEMQQCENDTTENSDDDGWRKKVMKTFMKILTVLSLSRKKNKPL